MSTALLIFTKGGETENVWFYDMESDGYSLDDKRVKDEKGHGDLQEIISKYNSRLKTADNDRKSKSFSVKVSEIIEEGYDLSYSKYKEEVFEEIEYEKPNVILDKLIGQNGLEYQITKGLNDLNEMLK